jgi:rare lipoprotein A
VTCCRRLIFVLALLLTLGSETSTTAKASRIQFGLASFYGYRDGFAGKRTANGERFNPMAFTAASRTLPFGARVRVTSMENWRSVIVIINDRGPYIEGRTIDLSVAAADQLQMRQAGVVRVLIELVDNDPAT